MDYGGRDPQRPYGPSFSDPRHEPYPDWPGDQPPPDGAPALPLRWRLLLRGSILLLSAAAFAVGVLFIYYTIAFPDPLSMRLQAAAPEIRRGSSSLPAELDAEPAFIPLDMLPPHAAEAVIAIEDRRFFGHPGLDPLGMLRAAIANMRAGRLAQGGSTITQQLAKNLFLTAERTWARKAEEVVLALWLELRLTKRDILELYLNRVYFGGGAHGIEAASQRYFGKSARDLELAEAAVIAGLLKAPSRYAPSASPDQAVARARVVIGAMREAGFISEEEAATALAADIRFSPLMLVPDDAPVGGAIDVTADAPPQVRNTERDGRMVQATTPDAAGQARTGAGVGGAPVSLGTGSDAGQGGAAALGAEDGMAVVTPEGRIRVHPPRSR